MKKLFYLLPVVMLCLASCKSLPERLDLFVYEVESNYESFSETDWMVMDQKCSEFKSEFAKKYDRMDPIEKDRMAKSFERYDEVVVKGRLKRGTDGVLNALEGIGEWIDGVIGGAEEDIKQEDNDLCL